MRVKERFKQWLNDNLKKNSGAGSSYISCIDWLSDKFHERGRIKEKSIFEIEDISLIGELHKETKQIQRNKDSFIYNENAPSYGDRFFYSASLNNYKKFLMAEKGQTESKTNDFLIS